ncbi:MAG: hypothetical protein K8F25_10665, partial [Fimbriimonadaceae bacterium]|nr:hypothetical protein [Alphaproteobacteria bacterium]
HYDIGMGRPFMADELEAEDVAVGRDITKEGEWRILRGQNKWRTAEECSHHPFPGTHPIVATGDLDWGGWRVPGTEYDRDPLRIEQQAYLISKAPVMAGLLADLVRLSDEIGDDLPSGIQDLALRARKQLIDAGIDTEVPSSHHHIDHHATVEKAVEQHPTPQQIAYAAAKPETDTQSPQHPPVEPGIHHQATPAATQQPATQKPAASSFGFAAAHGQSL